MKLKTAPWLDADTTPAIRSRHARNRSAEAFKAEAMAMLDTEATEGQIGIYATHVGGDFYGYAIKYEGKPAYFEEPASEAA
jgi:hypothetical protein